MYRFFRNPGKEHTNETGECLSFSAELVLEKSGREEAGSLLGRGAVCAGR